MTRRFDGQVARALFSDGATLLADRYEAGNHKTTIQNKHINMPHNFKHGTATCFEAGSDGFVHAIWLQPVACSKRLDLPLIRLKDHTKQNNSIHIHKLKNRPRKDGKLLPPPPLAIQPARKAALKKRPLMF